MEISRVTETKSYLDSLYAKNDFYSLETGFQHIKSYICIILNVQHAVESPMFLKMFDENTSSYKELKKQFCEKLYGNNVNFNDEDYCDAKIDEFIHFIDDYQAKFFNKIHKFYERVYLPDPGYTDEQDENKLNIDNEVKVNSVQTTKTQATKSVPTKPPQSNVTTKAQATKSVPPSAPLPFIFDEEVNNDYYNFPEYDNNISTPQRLVAGPGTTTTNMALYTTLESAKNNLAISTGGNSNKNDNNDNESDSSSDDESM